MAKSFKHSILFRIGLAMVIIVTLAFVGMLSSIFIADRSEGQAAAINLSGTLRMMSYRIENQLLLIASPLNNDKANAHLEPLIKEFDKRIHSNLLNSAIPFSKKDKARKTYNAILEEWKNILKPRLEILNKQVSHGTPVLYTQLVQFPGIIDSYVSKIDALVKLLEIDAENNIKGLRSIQIFSLLITSIITLITMYMIKSNLLLPMQELLRASIKVRKGDFSTRISLNSEDEFGEMISAFNIMSADLSKMYSDLEQRVKEKTRDLKRTNKSLELLYKTTRNLSASSSPLLDNVYNELLKDIETFTGFGNSAICLGDKGDTQAFKLASIMSESTTNEMCIPPNCQRCFGSGCTHIIDIETDETNQIFSTPIKDSTQQYGILMVGISEGQVIEQWQKKLIESVASHIAMAMNISTKASESRLLSLMEERSIIARELHDSLAQALSYLKIQVTRLDTALKKNYEAEKINQIVDELRTGLNSAYHNLRELLTTFRLKMDTREIKFVISDITEEFSSRNDIDIQFINKIGGCSFSPNSEIHIIQIIREALSNIVKHSEATMATIRFECNINGDTQLSIEDNGVGITQGKSDQHHYGLSIMRERAQSLGGKLDILPSALGGTCICVSFKTTGKH